VVSIEDRAGALFIGMRHVLPPGRAFDAPPSASLQTSNRESLPDKLHDANLAGSNNRLECTLILTEGDSAAAFAVRDLEVIGREFYGVLPLRGKIVNPRTKGARTRQDCTDPDLLAFMSSMGLCHETRDRSSLRYGQVIIMSDSDLDGYIIRGLIINYIHFFWPWLMANVLKIFVTPCVMAIKGAHTASFYHLQEYRIWRSTHHSDLGWGIRYIKGLASLTTTDANDLFLNFHRCRIELKWNDADGELLDLIFGDSKKCVANRKRLLEIFDPDEFVDYSTGSMTCADFIYKEFLQYSHHDIVRSIPSVIDGFKLYQRKILHCALQHLDSFKIEILIGEVCGKTAYYHGEDSLSLAIIGMAQDFVAPIFIYCYPFLPPCTSLTIPPGA
jgi:DNA topoisomerase II